MSGRFTVISVGGWNEVQLLWRMPEPLSEHIENLVKRSGHVDELELIKEALYLYEKAVTIKNYGGRLQYVYTVNGQDEVTEIKI